MKFIVPPRQEEKQDFPVHKPITLCWKCSEYPPACYEV